MSETGTGKRNAAKVEMDGERIGSVTLRMGGMRFSEMTVAGLLPRSLRSDRPRRGTAG